MHRRSDAVHRRQDLLRGHRRLHDLRPPVHAAADPDIPGDGVHAGSRRRGGEGVRVPLRARDGGRVRQERQARPRRGARGVQGRPLRLQRGQGDHPRVLRGHPARAEGGHRRAHRGREDHHGQPADALLRGHQRGHPHRRRVHQEHEERGRPRPVLHGPPGHLALRGDHQGEHRLQQPGRLRRAPGRGVQGRRPVPLHPHTAGRIRHRPGGQRQPVRRAEAAGHHRPRHG